MQKFDQRNSFNEVAQQDDDYTAADVEGSEDAPDMFEDRHINLVGENISCRPVDVDELTLIKKTPTFEDVESEEEDDTGGIMIQTDTHGEDVDAAATDDDYITFVVFACEKTTYYLCEFLFAMTTET